MNRFVIHLCLFLVSLSIPAAASAEVSFEYDLFDGRSLNGWKIENECSAEVKDGMLLLKDGDGWLRSEHEFTDFDLHVEWKALKAEKYDAGIYVRTKVGGGPYPKNGHQINLLQGREGDLVGSKEGMSRGLIKEGDWNKFKLSPRRTISPWRK